MTRPIRGIAIVCVLAIALSGCVSRALETFTENIPSYCAKGAGLYRAFVLSQVVITYSDKDKHAVAAYAGELNTLCANPPADSAQTLARLKVIVANIAKIGRK